MENVCLTKKSLCLIWVENRKQNLKSLEGRGVREKAGEFSCIYAFRLPFLGNNELTGIFQTSKVWNFTRGSTESKSLILKMRKWGGGEVRKMKPVGSKHQLHTFVFQVIFSSIIPFNPLNVSTRLVTLFSFHRWGN